MASRTEITAPAVHPPIGRCIYCRAPSDTRKLGEEHVIASGLKGTFILEEASCDDCARRTCSVETYCCREMFAVFRAQQNYKSQHRKKRQPRESFPVTVEFESYTEERLLAAKRLPVCTVMPIFPKPGVFAGLRPQKFWKGISLGLITKKKAPPIPDAKRVRMSVELNPRTFTRMLAKIAHSTAVAAYGLDGFRPFLIKHILEDDPYAPFLVGCDDRFRKPEADCEHLIDLQVIPADQGKRLVIAKVQLFAYMPTPTYRVVVGERLGGAQAQVAPASGSA